jgi:fatty acid desaturase
LFHEPQGLLYHGLALLYAFAGYVGGFGLLFSSQWELNALGTLLLGHAMIIAAYLIHECGHNTVFRANRNNERLGRFLSWMCGSSYGTFEDIRYKHFRHHMDGDDSVWFMYDEFFNRHRVLLKAVKFLEWFYIPAHDLLMHFIMVFCSWVIPQRRDQRLRNTVVIILRGGGFIGLLVLAPKVAVLYMVAYMIMMHVLRFMDAFQHDYGPNPILFEENPELRFGGRKQEQSHTFSNPVSFRWTAPNWLVLNFGFHNAHHARPTVPWYRLPAFYREKISNSPESVIPFTRQLSMYHRYRTVRVDDVGGDLDGLPEPVGEQYLARGRAGQLSGGNAVSFLTSF